MFILPLGRAIGSFWAFIQSMWNPPEAIPTPKDGVTSIPIQINSKAQQRFLDELSREY